MSPSFLFENGILTLTLPKAAEQARGKQIPAKVKKLSVAM
jgi:HSP20 family molecular chaperone IbpA